ncbi:MFS transporter [Microlunatus flavus]|uniref:Predicted arabinose efflux permease, MFS family n=1 Tax=Microlunatus flavus TaxID=1036181 RepID=A0A1H9I017_9ACTN|nr:MFS transporter [Microlunatus flavus]SEQ67812.1 Predicted arabinose efflux permease, MFS family [Microlunatus flavus]
MTDAPPAPTRTSPPALGPAGRAPARGATYREVFEDREMRVLLGTFLLRALSTTTEILGLSVLVLATTGSVFWSAVAYGVGFAPYLLGGSLLTSLADRLPARALVVVSLLVRAVPGLLIGLLHLPVAAMLALVFCVGAFDPVGTAATGRLTRTLLTGDRFVVGRSVLSAVGSVAQVAGLALGGVLLLALSPRGLLLVSGLALVLGALVARLGLRHHPVAHAPATGGAVRQTLRGNRRLLADPRVRGLLLAQWVPAWLVTGVEALVVGYVAHRGWPASGASLVLAAVPVGMLVGDLLVGRALRPWRREQLAFPLALLVGLPLVPWALGLPYAAVVGLGVACGLGFAYQVGLQRRFAESLPEADQGLGFGLLSSGLMGGQGLGPVAAGALAATLGPAVAVTTMGAVAVVAVLALRSTLRPDLADQHPQGAR